MTYGYAASPDKAWPWQLEGMTGKSVYNMSCGGYGPCEFKILVERGLKLTPSTVVMELYPGNAFAAAFFTVYVHGRFPELRTQDEAVLAEIRRADQVQTLPELAKELASGAGPRARPRRWSRR